VTGKKDRGSTLDLRVVPDAQETSFDRVGDSIKIRVSASPEKGKANKAVEQAFSSIDKDAKIIRGHTSKRKKLLLPNISPDRLESELEKILDE